MEEQLVSFEVAKLLKEKGFNILCRHCYGYKLNTVCDFLEEKKGTIYEDENDGYNWNDGLFPLLDTAISAPTQSLAQKWLRETKNAIILVNYESLKGYNIVLSHTQGTIETKFKATYEEALEEGLKEALKLI